MVCHDVEAGVCSGLEESQGEEGFSEDNVPCPGGLLEAIECLVEAELVARGDSAAWGGPDQTISSRGALRKAVLISRWVISIFSQQQWDTRKRRDAYLDTGA